MTRRIQTIRHDYAKDRHARAAKRAALAAAASEKEAKVKSALQRHEAPLVGKGHAAQPIAEVYRKAPRLADAPYADAVAALLRVPRVRALCDWSPRGKGRDALFRSLADHLLALFPTPPVFWSVFFEDARLFPLATRAGGGGSLFDVVREPAFPLPFTRRMCHELQTSRGCATLLEAIRRVQVASVGGDARLTALWMRTPPGRALGTREDEIFWLTVVAWLVKNPMLDPAGLHALVDYIAARRRRDPAFSMAGRSGPAMLRGLAEWHEELAEAKVVHGSLFAPSGFQGATYDLSSRGPPAKREIWRVEEILTSKGLASEGKRMNHCVYSYAWSIEKGQTSIWSVTMEDGLGETGRWAMLTIEVRNATKQVVQVRGRFNRMATSAEHKVLSRWAGSNNLSIV